MKKTLWTLNVDNYAPEIIKLTYPLLKRYAAKCGAEFRTIDERKFPDFPPVYEKLRIFELGQDSDWNIYIDSDAVIHPDMFDVTNHLTKDTVCHNANDMAGNRWKYDRFFLRDGRHIGSCNWFTIASNWCLELWKPLEDLTLAEAVANINPTVHEQAKYLWKCQNPQCQYEVPTQDKGHGSLTGKCTRCGQTKEKIEKAEISAQHLIDDYTLSRNIAKYGLKFTTVNAIKEKMNERGFYLWHVYTSTLEEKLRQTKEILTGWGIDA
jgi:hypothetical protein